MNQNTELSEKHSIILFDDQCVLCNGGVDFILKRDKKDRFKFSSLKSDYAKQLLDVNKISNTSIDSIILFENNNYYIQSTAALRITKNLSGFWPILYIFIFVPKILRDYVYNFIAKNRYRWFGQMDTCRIIDGPMRDRFME